MADSFDYNERSRPARVDAVRRSLSKNPKPTKAQMSAMADYILCVSDRGSTPYERKQEYPVLTRNRCVTIAKREMPVGSVSAEGMSSDDTLSSLSSDMPPDSATVGKRQSNVQSQEADAMRRSIDSLKAQADRASGKRRFELKRQVISQYRDLVVAGESSNPTPAPVARASLPPDAPGLLDDDVVVDPVTLLPHGRRGITMCDERCVLALMRDYTALKALSNGDARSDVSALLVDLEEAVDALYGDDEPMRLMVELKLKNATDADVAKVIGERLGVHRSASYWGARWSVHVPKAVADRARRLWLLRHWDRWKICTRCGRALPAHPMWFTRNSSKDGYYSRCKECRTAVRKEREDADRRGV